MAASFANCLEGDGRRSLKHGTGSTLLAASMTVFEQAALALTAVITHAEIKSVIPVDVSCGAPDLELLFVDWLNAVIYEMAVRKMLFGRFAVTIKARD